MRMADVMLSYSGRDIDQMNEVAQHLRNKSIELWIDSEGIEPGEKWRPALFEKLQSCDAFVPILSHNYLRSEHCRMEAFVARSFGRKMLPVMVDDCFEALQSHEETRGLQDIFMVRLQRLSMVSLPTGKMDMLDRLVAAIQHESESATAAEGFVYISYARDAEFATQLAISLLKREIPVWIATQNIFVGENWRDAQVRAMLRARCHLIVLDDEMLDRHVLRTEILLSEARGLPTYSILPPRLSTAIESGVTLRKKLEAADQTYQGITDAAFFRSNEEIEHVVDRLAPKLTAVVGITNANKRGRFGLC
jgi:TIR domain